MINVGERVYCDATGEALVGTVLSSLGDDGEFVVVCWDNVPESPAARVPVVLLSPLPTEWTKP